LPEIEVPFIRVDTFLQQLQDARRTNCIDSHGAPLLTILDFRNGNFLKPDNPPPRVKSNCLTQTILLDDLQDPEIRASIPRKGQIITITETGNRDTFVIRYLSQFGFSNIYGLEFGMRGWIKLGYPTEQPQQSSH
jgi:rhodanese-related sulfurtransferase